MADRSSTKWMPAAKIHAAQRRKLIGQLKDGLVQAKAEQFWLNGRDITAVLTEGVVPEIFWAQFDETAECDWVAGSFAVSPGPTIGYPQTQRWVADGVKFSDPLQRNRETLGSNTGVVQQIGTGELKKWADKISETSKAMSMAEFTKLFNCQHPDSKVSRTRLRDELKRVGLSLPPHRPTKVAPEKTAS